jgi:hypothetical protein
MTREFTARNVDPFQQDRAETPSAFEVLEGVVSDLSPPSGRLEKGSRPVLEVRMQRGVVEARRAASCLLAPAAGDRVLVAHSAGEAFILAVLERGECDVDAIELGSGVAIDVDKDRGVRLRGAKKLDLEASDAISATTSEVRVNARRASLIVRKIEAIGASVESSFDHVRQFGRVVEVIADEVSHRVKRSLRTVTELDQTRAGAIDTRAEGIIAIHGENTCVTARQIAKLDSNQIHIG